MRATFLVLIALALPVRAQEITVAAAADLRPALEEIAAHFQSASGIKLRTIYASSGDLFHQIENGAPFDVFLSASAAYPRKLDQEGVAVPGTYFEYAQGKIVLMVRSNSAVDISYGLKVLLQAEIKKIAVADPAHAPYGAAAVEALKAEKLYDQIAPKLVMGENISQTASFVLSGAADVGIVALSLVKDAPANSRVRYAEIPTRDYSPILQACVALRSSKEQSAAAKFESYLRSDEAASILRSFGFDIPAPH